MSSLFVSKKEVPLSPGAVVKCPLADCDEGARHAPISALLALFACFIHGVCLFLAQQGTVADSVGHIEVHALRTQYT